MLRDKLLLSRSGHPPTTQTHHNTAPVAVIVEIVIAAIVHSTAATTVAGFPALASLPPSEDCQCVLKARAVASIENVH